MPASIKARKPKRSSKHQKTTSQRRQTASKHAGISKRSMSGRRRPQARHRYSLRSRSLRSRSLRSQCSTRYNGHNDLFIADLPVADQEKLLDLTAESEGRRLHAADVQDRQNEDNAVGFVLKIFKRTVLQNLEKLKAEEKFATLHDYFKTFPTLKTMYGDIYKSVEHMDDDLADVPDPADAPEVTQLV